MLFTNQEQMKQYKINPGRGPTESQIQLYSFWAGKLTYSCPSLAETSICLNYSVCAALKLNSKKRLASKRKERTGSQLLFIRQEKTAKSRSTECACEVLQIQPRPRAPFGLGGRRGPGAHYYSVISKLILGGASPLGRKISNSDNKSRWYETTVTSEWVL